MALSAECRAVLRALLAAAAISCTLSIPRAQGTQRLTQIKDLICVLIMSGMQKEDLDVSMLRKLQRYNVNIDDMNNEQNRQECFSRNKDFTTAKNDENNDNYVSTTEKVATAIEDTLQGLSVAAVLNYLKSRQISHTTTAGKVTHLEKDTSATKYFETQPKINMNLLQRYVQLKNLNSSMYEADSTYPTTSNYKIIFYKQQHGLRQPKLL
ncbi:uncharacterized protein [Epargyreus clarus]|uniref:uncharacterized protein n=1 Tax=Epargyreus clarus TaxID=520877 RepID=UPI003C303575